MRKLFVVCVAGLGLVLAGCPSISTLGLARTLDKGETQVAVSPGSYGAATAATGTSGLAAVPQVEVAARYGVTDTFELGGKAWFLGASFDGKFSLVRSNGESGLDLAINPGVGFLSATASGDLSGSVGVLTLYLPLLVGLNFGGHQLVLGPKVIDQVYFSGGQATNVLFAGSSIGFAIKIGDGFRLLPELSVAYPLTVNTTGTGVSGLIYQANLAFLFGGYSGSRGTGTTPVVR